jgi:hypothetical protein
LLIIRRYGGADLLRLVDVEQLVMEERRQLPRGMAIEVYVNLFNLYDRQGEANVDATSAPPFRVGGGENNVTPIADGTSEDLVFAKATDRDGSETGRPTARNPNFRRPTTRYAPASAQVGFRLTF